MNTRGNANVSQLFGSVSRGREVRINILCVITVVETQLLIFFSGTSSVRAVCTPD